MADSSTCKATVSFPNRLQMETPKRVAIRNLMTFRSRKSFGQVAFQREFWGIIEESLDRAHVWTIFNLAILLGRALIAVLPPKPTLLTALTKFIGKILLFATFAACKGRKWYIEET